MPALPAGAARSSHGKAATSRLGSLMPDNHRGDAASLLPRSLRALWRLTAVGKRCNGKGRLKGRQAGAEYESLGAPPLYELQQGAVPAEI